MHPVFTYRQINGGRDGMGGEGEEGRMDEEKEEKHEPEIERRKEVMTERPG